MDRIIKLQERLEQKADAKSKAWWEKYLRYAIPFRGVKMGDIRTELHRWLRDESVGELSPQTQKDLALHLMRQTHCEDKLAGVLFLQEVLLPAGMIEWQQDLLAFAALFEEGYIHEWNTCDWFCVKVLGPLAEREGAACAQAIAEWRTAESQWQRRASGVAFVNLARRGEANFAGFTDMVLETCAATVQYPERFAQTGTGWVLRELSRAEPERVLRFIETYVAVMSSEALQNAVAALPPRAQARLKELHREARTVGPGLSPIADNAGQATSRLVKEGTTALADRQKGGKK